ncbi:MAG: AAA family ATPase [Desulfobacterales bacterium]|nr:AAA family ATPase [Desulfobacterales bacterium]
MNIENYPYPLAVAWDAFEKEKASFIRLHRGLDAFETLVRYCANISLSLIRLTQFDINVQTEMVKVMERPSLGSWVNLLRISIRFDQRGFLPELTNENGFFNKTIKRFIEGKNDLVSQRNKVAHGGFISKEKSLEFLQIIEPKVKELFEKASFLCEYPLIAIFEGKKSLLMGIQKDLIWSSSDLPDGIYLFSKKVTKTKPLPLFPLQAYRPILKYNEGIIQTVGEATALFYARMGKKYLDFHGYKGELSQDHDALKQFLQIFPLYQWRNEIALNDKYAFIEFRKHLLAFFKGREKEVEYLKKWVRGKEQHLFLFGKPGIGKSALATYAVRKFEENKIKSKIKQNFIIYYFQSNDGRCNLRNFLEAVVNKIKEFYGLSCFLPNEESEQIKNVKELLSKLSDKLKEESGELILILDGLDEAIARGHTKLVNDIPFICNSNSVRWLLVGRENCSNPFYDIKSIMSQKGVKNHELGAMSKEEVISVLQESNAKYTLLENIHKERMAELVFTRSEGNPLYLRALLEDLESGRRKMEINSFEQLPSGINSFFDEGMKRLGLVGQSQESKALLLTLAWSLEPLPLITIAEFSFNGFAARQDTLEKWTKKLDTTINKAIQFLIEDYSNDGTPIYSLYHEGLKEYYHQKEDLSEDLKTALHSLSNCLFDWRTLKGSSLSYSLKYAHGYIYQIRDTEKMWKLLKDEDFRQNQIKDFIFYNEVFAALNNGMKLYSEELAKKNEGEQKSQIESFARLTWMTLTYAEQGKKVRIYIKKIWQLARNGNMGDALKYLDYLDEKDFFKACIYLLIIETDRMEKKQVQKQPICCSFFADNANLVLDKIAQRIKPKRKIAGLNNFMNAEQTAWFCLKVSSIPNVSIFDRLINPYYYNDKAELAKYFIQKKSSDIALKIAMAIDDFEVKAKILFEIAKFNHDQNKYDEAIETAIKIEDKHKKSELLLEIAKATNDEEHYRKSLEAAMEIEDEDAKIEMSFKIAESEIEAKYYGKALQTAMWCIPSQYHKAKIYINVYKATGIFRDYIEAKNFTMLIEDEDKKEDALLELVKAHAKGKPQKESIQIAKGINSNIPKAKALLDIAKTFGTNNYYEEAIEIATSIEDEKDSSTLFLEITKALLENQQYERAIEIAEKIYFEDYKSIALLEIAKATGKQEHYIEAFQNAIGIESEDVKTEVLIEIAEAQKQKKQYELAIQTAIQIESENDKSKILLEIIKEQVKENYYEEAIQAAMHIESEDDKSKAFLEIAIASANSEYYEQAIHFDIASEGEYRKSVLLEIGKTLAENGQQNMAINIAKAIGDEESETKILINVANSQIHDKKYEQTIQTVKLITNNIDREKLFIKIVEEQVKDRSFNEALHTVTNIEDTIKKANVFLIIAKAANDKDYYDKAIKAAINIDDEYGRAKILLDIAKATDSKELYDKAIKAAINIDDEYERAKILLGIAKATDSKELYDKAIETAILIDDENNKEDIFLEIADAQIKNKKYEQAIKTIDIIKSKKDKLKILLQAAKGADNKDYYEQAIKTVMSIKNKRDKSKALFDIAKAFDNKDYYEQAIKTAIKIDKIDISSELLLNIAKTHIQDREYEQALKTVKHIKCNVKKSEALIKIANASLNSEIYHQVLEIVTYELNENQKFSILNNFMETISAIEPLEILIKYYEKSQKGLSYQLQNDLIKNFIKNIYALETISPEQNLSLLLRLVPLLPFGIETIYQWFTAFDIAVFKLFGVEAMNKIHEFCPQLELKLI